jgi:hypothetical protein
VRQIENDRQQAVMDGFCSIHTVGRISLSRVPICENSMRAAPGGARHFAVNVPSVFLLTTLLLPVSATAEVYHHLLSVPASRNQTSPLSVDGRLSTGENGRSSLSYKV